MATKKQNSNLHNPHLDGSPIFSISGKIGVLLLHGFAATPLEVRRLARFLEQKGISVAAPVLAGHGTTPEDLNNIHWGDWIKTGEDGYAQLAARCDHVFVGGESTGAVVSLYLAATHPEIMGVLAFSPAMRLSINFIDKFVLKFLSWVIKFSPKNGLEGNTTWQGYRANPLNGVKQLIALENETLKKLKDVTQPVMVFIGGQDTTIDLSSSDIVIEGVSSPAKEKHFFENSQHCILLGDDFDKAANLSLQFIQGHGKI